MVVRYPPYVGGVELATHELCRRWQVAGHAVEVICAAEPAGPALVDGVPVQRLPWRGRVGNTNLCWGLGRALRGATADLLHTSLPTAGFAERAVREARRRGWPAVLSYYNDLVGSGAKGLVARLYNRFVLPGLLDGCDRIVVSRSDEAGLSPHLARHSDRLVRIPLGVDLERFAAAPSRTGGGPLRVGFLSLLDAHHGYKGLADLLAAVAAARRAGAALELTVGGEGSERPRYQRLAAELDLGEEVKWTGFVPAAELPGFFAAQDLFALPSTDARQEGFGLVLLEAMACARPVLTTTVAGMASEVAAAGAGWVIAPGAPAELAAVLRRVAGERSAIAEAGRAARRLVATSFSWEVAATAYARLFEELMAASATPPDGR